MELREFIRRKTSDLQRAVFGPSIVDRDFIDKKKIPNPTRTRMDAAKIIPLLTSKEKALIQVNTSTIGIWSDYKTREEYHDLVRQHACRLASQHGATDEEIRQAIHDGNLEGATARQGCDDYWRSYFVL